MTSKDYWTVKAMRRWGGSFVKTLADLAQTADPTNLMKMKKTWANYWAEYEELGEKLDRENTLKNLGT